MRYPDIPETAREPQGSAAPIEKEAQSPSDSPGAKPPLKLILRLCEALMQENINYCHWKSNNALDRSASGENDLDLLISRADFARFTALLFRLGFKEAAAPPDKQLPGVMDFYGHDRPSGGLVHVHAHYQLVMGHDLTKNVRLPIEAAYLSSAVQDGLFRVPGREFEFIVLVIRLILKHATWDVILGKDGPIRKSERQELEFLQERVDRKRVNEILSQNLPYVSAELFQRWVDALRPGAPVSARIRAGRELQRVLEAGSRQPPMRDALQKQWRRWAKFISRRVLRSRSRHRLSAGGAMIAIVGGDGSGKTTTVESLYAWLSRDFDTLRVHLGKPRESVGTIVIRAVLRTGQLIGLYPHLNSVSPYLSDSGRRFPFSGRIPWMIRDAMKSRDRYLAYLRARRFVNNGGIVICDRFPLPQIKRMDGPSVEQIAAGNTSRLAALLVRFERRYYQAITPPELVIVLRLDPDEAVRRKTEEDAAQVHARSAEIWETDWRGSGMRAVDTNGPREEVLAEVKALVWSQL
ncbi:MAG: hypothetical protein ACM3QS_17360 [Bacteroidota bacterium]